MRYVLTFAVILCIAVPVSADTFGDFLTDAFRFAHGALLFFDVLAAADYDSTAVRSFAVRSISRTHGSYLTLGDVCDVWDAVAARWLYVEDPLFAEYVAPASESIALGFRGDCDDHAVLVAASLRAIGAAAIVRIDYGTDDEPGHAHPMAYLGNVLDDPDGCADALAYVMERYGLQEIAYSASPDGTLWLPMDWQAPGALPLGRRGESYRVGFAVPIYPLAAILDPSLMPAPSVP